MSRVSLLGAWVVALACTSLSTGQETAGPSSNTYRVQSVPAGTIVIDGKLGESEWPADAWLTDFSFPWRERKTPRTEMCCVCDGKNLLFAFRCDDSDLVLRGAVPEDEMTVAQGDRVELFFAKDPALKEYYGFEMNPAGNVLDYQASSYRNFNRSWDCPSLILRTATHRGGYVVEGSIPLTTLKEMCGADLAEGQPVLVGAFRAEYSHQDDEAPEEAWISWVKPRAETPDFHIPSAFGTFRLTD